MPRRRRRPGTARQPRATDRAGRGRGRTGAPRTMAGVSTPACVAHDAVAGAGLERHIGARSGNGGGRPRRRVHHSRPPAARRACDHLRAFGLQLLRGNAPARRRRGDEHLAPDRARATQRIPAARDRVAAARALVDQAGVPRRLLDAHLVQAHVEFLGDEQRERRLHALPHVRVLREQRDRAVGADLYQHVRAERVGAGARRRREDAQQHPAACQRRELEEAATVDADGRHVPAPVPAASLIAARMRRKVPQRQRLPAIAASMSASVGVGVCASSAVAGMICPAWQ